MSRSQRYESLRGSEAPGPSRSKDAEEGPTESGANFGDDEERAWGTVRDRRAMKQARWCVGLTLVKMWMDTIFLLIILLLFLAYIWPSTPAVEPTGDITGFAPESELNPSTYLGNEGHTLEPLLNA